MKGEKLVCYRVISRLVSGAILAMLLAGCGGGTSTDNSDPGTQLVSKVFDFPPLDLNKVEFILPMGGMIGNHVTPIDHQYYVAPDFGAAESIEIDVYAPADGVVTSIQHMGNFNNDDYRFVVQHNEAISSIYIHVDNL